MNIQKDISDFIKKNILDKDIECPICLNSIVVDRGLHLTSCGHIFCAKCISRHLQMGKTECPICRELLIEKDGGHRPSQRAQEMLIFDALREDERNIMGVVLDAERLFSSFFLENPIRDTSNNLVTPALGIVFLDQFTI